LAGGINTYAYVAGNPLGAIDPFGLLKWNNLGTTIRGGFDFSQTAPPTSPFQGPGVGSPKILATASADWAVRPTCVCEGGSYVLDEYEVDFRTFINLKARYASRRQRNWVLRGEGDHVADFNNWAAGTGMQTAQAVENKLKEQIFGSLSECQQFADATMFNNLGPSFDKAIDATRAKWDTSGLHSYGGPNAKR
jgi:hypothetical protein